MANPENLKSHEFKKGQSGNPNGRPKSVPELKPLLEKLLSEEKSGITALEAVFKSMINRAVSKGDVVAARELLDRYFGKVPQKTDVTTNGNSIVVPKIEIIYPKDASE